MSFAVLHMQKMKASSLKGIENHNERLKESRTNPDIDKSKTHLNIDFHKSDERTYYMRVKDRIQELNLPKAVRKDAVVAVGFVATSDKAFFDNLSPDQTNRFFKLTHDFLKERYGEKNVIASKLHLDEKTPHLHTYIVPVTSDGRLSAKDVFTRSELKSLQTDYHKHMVSNGFDMEKGQSSRSHIDTAEFKKQTAYKELNELESKIANLVSQKNALEIDLNAFRKKLDPLKDVQVDFDKIDSLEAKYGVLNKNKVTINADEFESLKKLAKKSIVLEKSLANLTSEKNSIQADLKKVYQLLQEDREKNQKLTRKYKALEKENDTIKEILGPENMEKVMKKINLQEQKSLEKTLKPKVQDLEV